ncbi:disease resistance protein RGA2-like [Ipomoea triloba]|uniref:disease resistance protein RGA2-like n=1 Tax=Ipomoea triloba TaxID=35885 RepID=UPI00125DFAB0|nr:disease resistance protein RGA2-like [Ipomoea triloba]
MADALISTVVEQLINILKHQAQELKRALGVEKEIANLSSKLENIREVLDDAEKRSFKDKGIKLWIQNIQDFCYQVDDVLDEWRTRTLRQQIESPEASRSSFLPSRSKFKRFVMHRDIAKKIKELDSTLDRITKEKDQFRFDYASITHTSAASHSDQELMRVTTAFDVDASHIQGRKSDASALISKLLENPGEEEARNGPHVISIVGTGGIGKTTLAQLVFEDEQIKTHFGDERVWICVSDPFDQIKIAKAIVESITKSSTDLSQLQLLLEKIKSTLSGKRFLLVMDDVWTEQSAKWEPLKNSLKDGLPGSRILVTSRKERVAKMMGSVYLHQLDLISDSEAWLLFSRIAFSGRSEEDCEKLKDIGHKIAQKCKGLPLAVKVMGSLLCFKHTRDDWQNVLDNKIWESDEVVTELFPHLYLSYNDLTPNMKQCFSYCAVFPKDYKMKVDMLIRIWMAQGYVTMESKGRELFRGLAMRSFFQDLKKDDMDSNIIKSCKMHDIVHDFAQFLTRNECYNIDQHEDKVGFKNLRHLQSWQDTGRNMNLPSICDIGKLRSFFAKDLSPAQLTLDLFNGLKSVRVLSLHGCELEKLPKKIGNLIHLRYIDLSASVVNELPDAVCSLYNLQTLDLKRCGNFSRLPDGIGNLRQLRYIDLTWSELETLPDTICSLENLQTLDLKGCEQFSRLPDGIGNLRQLRYIDLSWSKVKTLPDTICSLENLQTLDLEGCKQFSRLPDGIGNLRQLRYINLSCSEVETLPDTICSLENLQTLVLRRCEYFSRLPEGIGNLINLRHLKIRGSNRLEMMPPGIAKLTQLCSLSGFKVGKESSKLGYMEKLNQLKGNLSIFFLCDLNNAADVEEAEKAELRNKKHIKELCLNFSDGVDVGIDVMEALKPPPELQTLELIGYGGIHLPSWILLSLDNLRNLEIWNWVNCSSLPPLGKLPSLETLLIAGMKELRYVGSEFLGVVEVGGVAFPKLKTLQFYECNEWEEWEDLKEEATIIIMPCIRELVLSDCRKLKTVPHHLLSRLQESLKIVSCPGVSVGIDAQKPPLELQTLELTTFGGSHFPSWITLFLNLRIFKIIGCFNCSSLPPLGKLPFLETIFIGGMKELRYVGREFLGVTEVGGVAFPKLKKLEFYQCCEWEEWEDLKEEATIIIMPCIRELLLFHCEKLKTVPHHLLSRLQESLKIFHCPLLKVE